FETPDKQFAALSITDDLQLLGRSVRLLSHRQQGVDRNQSGSGRIGPGLGTDDAHTQPGEAPRSDADRDGLDVPRSERAVCQQVAQFRHECTRMALTFAGEIPLLQQHPVAPQSNAPLMARRLDPQGDHGSSSGSSSTTTGAYASSNISNRNREAMVGLRLPNLRRVAARVSVSTSLARVTPT